MVKFIMCCTRHPDMSRKEFQDYWLNKHAPFFMENASKMRAKKYIQSHTIDTPLNDGLKESRGMQAAYDGVAEVWFESEEDLMAAMSSPEFQEVAPSLVADENKFIDHSKSTAFIVNEIEL